MKAGEQAPEAILGMELLRHDLGSVNGERLLCYGTFELRCALDRHARHSEVGTPHSAEAEIEPDAAAEPIVSGPVRVEQGGSVEPGIEDWLDILSGVSRSSGRGL